MFDENNIYNNYQNNEPNHYQEEDDDGRKISRFQQQRRLKERKLERKVKKSNQKIRLFRTFAKLCLIIFLIALCYHTLRLKYWRLNPQAFSSLGNTSIKIENNYIASSERILKAVKEKASGTDYHNYPIVPRHVIRPYVAFLGRIIQISHYDYASQKSSKTYLKSRR